jgi:hypothetical protein
VRISTATFEVVLDTLLRGLCQGLKTSIEASFKEFLANSLSKVASLSALPPDASWRGEGLFCNRVVHLLDHITKDERKFADPREQKVVASPKVLAIHTGFYIRIQRLGKLFGFYPSKRHNTPITVRMKSADNEE